MERESQGAANQAERVDILAENIAMGRKRLDNITALRVDAEPGGEVERSLREMSERIAAEIKHMQRSLDLLQSYPGRGVTKDAARAIAEFAAEVRQGI